MSVFSQLLRKMRRLRPSPLIPVGVIIMTVLVGLLYLTPSDSSAENPVSGREEAYDAEPWGRSPFVEKTESVQAEVEMQPDRVAGLSGLVLKGVVLRENKRAAIINRSFVHEGDVMRGLKVVHIGEREVIFKQGDQEARLVMGASETLLPVIHLSGPGEEEEEEEADL